jgi:hypothetical protein
MTRKALLVVLGIAALVALATAPALGQITGGGSAAPASAAGDAAFTPELRTEQNLQAIMNLRVSRSLSGSRSEPDASGLAAVGVAVALVAVQVSLHQTLRRRNAA